MKRLTLLLALCALMLTFSVPASADDINFSGGVTLTQTGTAGSPSVNFTFSGLAVSGMSGDSLNGTAVSLTGSFAFSSIAGSNGLFSPNSGTLSIGNATTGTLTGDVTFVSITQGSFPGTFAISIGLSNVNVVTGTSAALNGWQGTNGGSGVLTFQFSAGGTLNDLLHMGTGVGALGQTGTIETSVSGSVTVPEPASLFLLGSGLLAGGGFVRRKLQR